MSKASPVEADVSADAPALDASGIGDAATLPSPRSLTAKPAPGELLPVVDPAYYALEGELAHGGIGPILRARDLRLGRPVALKQMLLPSPEAESRFMTEALVTARLQHPAIMPVYEAGRWPDGELFYSMKLVSGRSLADVLAESKTLDGDDPPEARHFDRGVRDPWCAGAIRQTRVGSALMSMALPGPLFDLLTPNGCMRAPFCALAPGS